MSGIEKVAESSENFAKKLLKIYLEDRDFSVVISMFSKDITWIGTGKNEVCKSYDDAVNLIESQSVSWDGKYKIVEQWYKSTVIAKDECLVYGEIKIARDVPSLVLSEKISHFSMIVRAENNELKLFHAHFSVPNILQIEDEYVHRAELKKVQDELSLSQKRYDVALKVSGLTMFEYNIATKELILSEEVANMYALPRVIRNGAEVFVTKGGIEPVSATDYLEMYKKIEAGAPFAKCYVKTRDKEGVIRDFELSLTTVFDVEGTAIRAFGVRKNAAEMLKLKKEQEFGLNFASDKELMFEANITANTILKLHDDWLEGFTNLKYKDAVEKIADEYVVQEHRSKFKHILSVQNIGSILSCGENLIRFEYKMMGDQGGVWHEATMNIVRDTITHDVIIRFYLMNINVDKKRQQKALEEKRLYEAMIAKAMVAYEVNITKNLAIKGHENWSEIYDIKQSSNYSKMIYEFSQKGTHPEDGAEFLRSFNRNNVTQMFEKGMPVILCQYRKKSSGGEYKWYKCTMHLYEDPESFDIKGFSYVEDIDVEKRREITLQYNADHDTMTGILNKTTTELRINEFLQTPEAKLSRHAMLIIDVDYFKYVNDNFGHLFGDAVIKEVAAKIRSVFRDRDIVGRIGGDEFCVLMKDVADNEIVLRKSAEICNKIMHTYKKDGKSSSISASIGLAMYSEHGANYESLYRHADESLYVAKGNGRNRYQL